MNVAVLNNSTRSISSVSEQIERSGNHLRKLWERDVVLRADDLQDARTLLADIEQIMPGLNRFSSQLDSVLRPADQNEIADHLIAIRLNFHNSKATGEAYGRIMTERVEARRPSVAALDSATREIIDRRKFMPVTAEVLEALEEAQRRFDLLRDIVRTLPARRERLLKAIQG